MGHNLTGRGAEVYSEVERHHCPPFVLCLCQEGRCLLHRPGESIQLCHHQPVNQARLAGFERP